MLSFSHACLFLFVILMNGGENRGRAGFNNLLFNLFIILIFFQDAFDFLVFVPSLVLPLGYWAVCFFVCLGLVKAL